MTYSHTVLPSGEMTLKTENRYEEAKQKERGFSCSPLFEGVCQVKQFDIRKVSKFLVQVIKVLCSKSS